MTTMLTKVKKCVLCGQRDNYVEIRSTNRPGPPDLGFRPPEMQRSTVAQWVVLTHNGSEILNG